MVHIKSGDKTVMTTFSVSAAEKIILEKIQHKILDYHEDSDPQDLKLARFISDEMRFFATELVSEVKKLSGSVDAIFICGLPTAESYDARHLKALKCISVALAYLIGHPFQYCQQNEGQIAAEIKPTEGLMQTQSSGGVVEFGWHTDDFFFPKKIRAQWILLSGFYNSQQTMTRLALVNDIVRNLSSKSLAILMAQKFQVRLPVSIALTRVNQWSDPITLIRINGAQQYEIGVPTFDVRPIDAGDMLASAAIADLIVAANQSQNSFCINNGSALIFNNSRTMHARSAITGQRKIIRTYIRSDLSDLRALTGSNGNVFDAEKLSIFSAGMHG